MIWELIRVLRRLRGQGKLLRNGGDLAELPEG